MNRRFSAALLTCALLSSLVLPVGALDVVAARDLLAEHYVDALPPAVYEAGSLDELLAALDDPYTVYYTREQYESFLTSVNGDSVCGIGISLRSVYEDGYEILSILPNSPALEAGLIPGEKIIAVDGIPLTPNEPPTNLIAGQEGTDLTVTLRASDGTVRDVTMTRRVVQIPIASFEQLGSAGYIQCESFGESAPEVVEQALTELAENSAVWILDLRDNPGGTSTASAIMAGAFLGAQRMVYFRDSDGTYYVSSTTSACVDMTDSPLIILTGNTSASASELFSGAIRDHSGGITIGARTYGKGVAQTIFDCEHYPELFEEDALKITTHRFFSPDGATNHLIGIIPTLLMEQGHAKTAALLLSAPQPKRSLNNWKLELAGYTFYLDQDLAAQEPEVLTELLEALPPSANLFCGTGSAHWREADVWELAEEFSLSDYAPRTFPDISGHPYEREINTLRTYYLLSGDENGLFHPEASMTRGELAAMLTSALNLPAGKQTFSDVPENAWYANAVSAIAARGFMKGDGTGAFHPEATLTNQELYTVLSAVAAWASMDGYEWAQKDVSAVQWVEFYAYPEWAQGPARNLDKLGLTVDRENPNVPVTRGDAAGLLCTMLENLHILWNK